ncbi:MAG: BMP family ABC transporter substrate-binding protein [Blautia sp.]|nr:BMP family ABC transporter substrate-binding protein [Eubacteriales bacterium]MED9967433.1 BMP family ABC transporter substrate-binding protein [Blautia sp.]
MKKSMKKFVSLLLAAVMVVSVFAFNTVVFADADPDFKVGVILIGDETEGYSTAHINGIKEAAKELGIDEGNIIWKYKVPEDSTAYDSAIDLVGQGCQLVISNSYGHQTYMVQAAMDYPDTTFIAMTGDFAAISGCPNFKNAFTGIYESRYVSGVVAGLKLKELMESGTLTAETQPESFDKDGNVKVGYVGAFSYAEVVSGYTAFFLGIRSVVPNAVMEVKYTNSWFDIDKEGAAAEALIANGAAIIGQHADSTGAPAATQKLLDSGKICYSVGYNIDMLETAPTAALTSATNNWAAYYKHAFETVMNGGELEADWAKGYSEDAVGITPFGESCAEGTAEYIADVEAKLKDGTLHVFDTSTFTVGGEEVTTAPCDLSFMDFTTNPPTAVYEGETVEAIKDGYFAESEFRSAPYFTLRIDGITEDEEAVE